jgi:hypothetical protein
MKIELRQRRSVTQVFPTRRRFMRRVRGAFFAAMSSFA